MANPAKQVIRHAPPVGPDGNLDPGTTGPDPSQPQGDTSGNQPVTRKGRRESAISKALKSTPVPRGTSYGSNVHRATALFDRSDTREQPAEHIKFSSREYLSNGRI